MYKFKQLIKRPLMMYFLVLVGCTPAHKKVEQEFIDYVSEPLNQGTKPEGVKMDGKPIKVAVAEFTLPNDNASPDYQAARLANLKQYAAEIVNDAISKAGGALVNKEDALKIRDYIQSTEKHGNTDEGKCSNKQGKHGKHNNCSNPHQKSTYTGLNDVDYAMLGEISSVSYGSQTSSSAIKINGTNPLSCNYSASISGTLAVYKIPNTVRESSIRFQADDTELADGACPQGSLNPQVIKLAMEKAINKVKAEFQNPLAIDAYVIEKRVQVEKKKSIFQISAGKNLNLHPGEQIRLMHVDKHVDPVTGKIVDQQTMVGQGILSDKVEADRSWVLVDQSDDKGISMWDIARPFHENCQYLSLCKMQE